MGLFQDKDRDKIFIKRERKTIKRKGDYVIDDSGSFVPDKDGRLKVHLGDVVVVSNLFNFDGQSRQFIKRYLIAFELLSLVAMISMGFLLYAAMTPAQGDGFFVDVVSGKIFALIGKNMF